MTTIVIAGHRLRVDKPIFLVLRKIFGIGLNKVKQIMFSLNLSKKSYLKDINYSQQLKLNKIIIHYVHGFRAKRNLKNYIMLLYENKCYRGVRHSYFLSVRGQNTRTNAKTQKNKKIHKNKKYKKKENKII